MAYVVTQSCCSDASCVVACPVNCIHPAPGEPGFAEAEMVYIDADTCVGCGACVTACPVGAIVPDVALTPEQQPFAALAAEYYDVFPHADRTPVALVAPPRRLRARGPFRVAVVGAGPAGMYAADALLHHPQIGVDVLDRLPVPHGLARFGVAPDHPRTRAVTDLFDVVARHPRFTYRLGVEVGRDVSREQLTEEYDAVVWATGASADRPLDVPGADRPGVVGATELSSWFNGHPERRDLDPLLLEVSGRAVVVGVGNVALDAARLLVGGRTDIDEVVVLARRGAAEAAFTTPELIGLAGMDDVDVRLEAPGPDIPAGTDVRSRLLAELAGRTPRGDRPRIVLRFHAPIDAVLGDDRVRGVRLRDGTEIEAELVVGAIGHRWTPVEHDRGRVAPGTYVVGWAKRGPSGFIGTNKSCAEETVARLVEDLEVAAARPVVFESQRRPRGFRDACCASSSTTEATEDAAYADG